MVRKIIKIDEEKCNGCGLCIDACHEGALELVNGKAKLISESYCDGLGDCLPQCPTGAIKIEEREADNYDEEAVKARMESKKNHSHNTLPCGCPGSHAKVIERPHLNEDSNCTCHDSTSKTLESQLRQWPCQIKLVPVNAPYFNNSNLLIAADCTAYAYANIHGDFMKNKVTLIGCPKLDNVNYADKLTEIIKHNDIKSITVLRMEVPCCSGLANAVKQALFNSGKMIPWRIVVIGTDGSIVEE
ncbi:ATP-binding protein [Lutispora thermophila]|uniref:4Fe-4S binding domain-containing protein n=1 Tax=Lutispora thermophila DSM 19022 TaxID=1122184 RepID=A0A1M6D992_9FIRM|nr:4Fe-4S binding protein [Lutispora thermophila]SHI69764.1 4Fe-4S binding domain-containing protein [Lutispora thermophila DSM 19022]